MGVSPATLDRLTAAGQIPAYKIGGRRKYREEEIQAYFNSQRLRHAPQVTQTTRHKGRRNEPDKYVPKMKII